MITLNAIYYTTVTKMFALFWVLPCLLFLLSVCVYVGSSDQGAAASCRKNTEVERSSLKEGMGEEGWLQAVRQLENT